MATTYAVASVPFIFSGICVSIVFTRFAPAISRLYGADLLGAALGCIVLGWALKISDGPTTFIAWLARRRLADGVLPAAGFIEGNLAPVRAGHGRAGNVRCL